MAKIYSKIWTPLSVYTARHLPFPGGPLRVGERLGKDRRLTVLRGRHLDGDIKIRKCAGRCAPCTDACEVKPGDWGSAEYALSLLIGKDWASIGPVEVLAYEPIEEPACDPAEPAGSEPANDAPNDADIVTRMTAFMNEGERMKEAAAFEAVCTEFGRANFTIAQWTQARTNTLYVKKFRRGYRK